MVSPDVAQAGPLEANARRDLRHGAGGNDTFALVQKIAASAKKTPRGECRTAFLDSNCRGGQVVLSPESARRPGLWRVRWAASP
jgi:hypothetical protein